MQADLDQEEKDRTLMAALDEARLKQAETPSTNRFAPERALPVFREALRAYGLAAGEGDPKAAAERIRGRPAAVREAIAAALDEWDEMAGSPRLNVTEPPRPWLQAVPAAAEPDAAWSLQVRAARAEKDGARRRVALEKPAASADAAHLPARSLTRLARQLAPAPKEALLRRAHRRYPADFWVNHDLGVAPGDVTPPERDEAVRFLTAAAALRPDSPGCLINLGQALKAKAQLDEAIACYRKLIEIDPKNAPARTQLEKSQRLAAARDKLPAFRDGSDTPASNEERLDLIEWRRIQTLHGTSPRLYAEAFATDPKPADDLKAAHRCNAACSAALAAAGKGEEATDLDVVERARLRKQALDWLRADLALRTNRLAGRTPADPASASRAMRSWRQARDLAGIRDPEALAQLPESERNDCEALWADVQALTELAQRSAPGS